VNRISLRHTTVFRLALVSAGLYGLITIVVIGIIYWSTSAQIDAQVDAGLRAESAALTELDRAKGLSVLKQEIDLRLRHSTAHTASGSRYYLLADASYHRLLGNIGLWPQAAHRKGVIWLNLAFDTPLEEQTVRSIAVTLPDGNHLLVGQSMDATEDLREHVFLFSLGAIIIVAAISLLGGYLTGSTMLGKLDAISHAAAEIMGGDLSRRIPTGPRNDEFDDLAHKLNAMFERIEQLMAGMRQVTDNVAHDLRSPLARLRNRLEVTLLESRHTGEYRTAIEQTIADADTLIQTFNAMLSLAQIDAGVQPVNWRPIDLSALAADLGELYGAAAEEKGLDFTVETDEQVFTQGDPRLLARAVGNLLDNAVKYTPHGGDILLAVRRSGDYALVTVADSGPGIPVDSRETVLERFVRLDTSRTSSGNGLGLSLVRSIAQLHRARLILEDNRPGLRATVRLPLHHA